MPKWIAVRRKHYERLQAAARHAVMQRPAPGILNTPPSPFEAVLAEVAAALGLSGAVGSERIVEAVRATKTDAEKWRKVTSEFPAQGSATDEDTIFYLCKDGKRWEEHLGETQALQADAERWRREAPNLIELGNWWHSMNSRHYKAFEEVRADAELGALVRQMPDRGALSRQGEQWCVRQGDIIFGFGTETTPEEALSALIGEPTE